MKQIIAGFVVCPLIISLFMGLVWWSGGLGDSPGNMLIGLALFVAVLMLMAITLYIMGII